MHATSSTLRFTSVSAGTYFYSRAVTLAQEIPYAGKLNSLKQANTFAVPENMRRDRKGNTQPWFLFCQFIADHVIAHWMVDIVFQEFFVCPFLKKQDKG